MIRRRSACKISYQAKCEAKCDLDGASGAPKAGHSHAPPSSSQHLRLAHQDVLDIVRLFLEVGHTRSTAIVRTLRVAVSRKDVERTLFYSKILIDQNFNEIY